MKTMKKIAWLLCFVLIVSSVVGNNYLKAEAQGEGTTFTVNVTDESGLDGNSVSYRFGSEDSWKSVPSDNAIDIAEQSSITIKATANEGARVEAASGGGFTESDFGGITGENGQTFDLADTVSYVLNVNFKNNSGDSASGNLGFTYDDTSLGFGVVQWLDAENNWHTQQENGTVNAVAVRIQYSNNGMLANQTALRVDGADILSASKEALESENGFVLESGKNYIFEHIQFSSSTGGNTPDSEPIENPVTIAVNITSGTEYLDTFGTYLKVDGRTVEKGSVTVEQAETHVISVLPQFGYEISTSINGTVVTGTESDGWVSYTVDEADSYNILISLAGSTVYTVVWDYVGDFGSDAIVSNGTVKIISATLPDGGNGIGAVNDQNEAGGHVVIEPGSTVKVEIKPNYGYQFVAGSLNGQTITAGTEVGYFTFTMPSANLHLAALFTASEDKKVITASGVSDAKMENCEGIIDSGNLELTVKDAELSETQKSTLQGSGAGKGVAVDQWLEVDLDQIVNKGNADDVWRIDQDELPHKIKVALNVGKNLDPDKEYVVVREHNGAYERIPADYDPVAGTLTFESDKFSNYAVGTVETVLDTIDNTWNGEEKDAGAAVETLINTYGMTGIATAVQDAGGTVNTALVTRLQALESDYIHEKTIIVKDTEIKPAVSGSVGGKVDVTGAAFNADDGKSVQLVIDDKAGNGIKVGSTYSKAVQLDIKLEQTEGNTTKAITDLRMPVTITMPVPAGISASRMVILHDKNGDGTSDETVPYSLSGNRVTFTVTHFSNFAFAEKAVSTGGGGGGSSSGSASDSGSSSSDSDGSSSSEPVKEEKVSVPAEYIVAKGDTLGRIARKNNMTLSALLALNPQIKNPNLIHPGQKIIVGYTTKTVTSKTTTTPAANSNAEYYTVQKGDFLYRIARKNGLSLNQLAAMNPGIMNQKYIYPGQKIRVR